MLQPTHLRIPPRVHPHFKRLSAASLLALFLAACGGGGGSSSSGSTTAGAEPGAVTTPVVTTPVATAGAPQATGNTAADGFAWFNYRRQQIGLSTLTRNAFVDVAAQGHSEYQKANDTITHTQTAGKPGFTGVNLADRLTASGFRFNSSSYAHGEVISSTTSTSGQAAAEDLITAIYHRFVVFEPMFKEAGAGAATVNKGYTYFTADFVADNLNKGVGQGKYVIYPFPNQTAVLTVFNSDYEAPDPVPNRNAVGYPISIHADLTATVRVTSFTVAPHGGANLQTILLQNSTDPQTYKSVAAIIPLEVLAAGTTYDVRFVGTIDSLPVDRSWSFTTK